MSQAQGTSSETDLAVGTLQWKVLFTAALCPPSRGLAPSPKRSLREGGPKAAEGREARGKAAERIWDHGQQTLPWGMEPLSRNRK